MCNTKVVIGLNHSSVMSTLTRSQCLLSTVIVYTFLRTDEHIMSAQLICKYYKKRALLTDYKCFFIFS